MLIGHAVAPKHLKARKPKWQNRALAAWLIVLPP